MAAYPTVGMGYCKLTSLDLLVRCLGNQQPGRKGGLGWLVEYDPCSISTCRVASCTWTSVDLGISFCSTENYIVMQKRRYVAYVEY